MKKNRGSIESIVIATNSLRDNFALYMYQIGERLLTGATTLQLSQDLPLLGIQEIVNMLSKSEFYTRCAEIEAFSRNNDMIRPDFDQAFYLAKQTVRFAYELVHSNDILNCFLYPININ